MRRIVMWGMIAVLGMPIVAAAQAQPSSPPTGRNAVQPPGPVPLTIDFGAPVVQTEESKDSKYWLGLSCAAVDATIRAQLGLEAGSGLVVRQTADNSPAKEAGLAIHDIILHVAIDGETYNLADVSQLTKLIQQAERKPMTFSVLRRGKPLTITVTPGRTVAGQFQNGISEYNAGEVPLFFRMAGPVMSVGVATSERTNLPDDLTVVITKSGKQPIEVTIRQKDRGEWKLREKESAAQPQNISQAVIDVMAYLSRLVGRMEVQQGKEVFRLEPGPQGNMGYVQLDAFGRSGINIWGGTTSASSGANPSPKPATLSSLQHRLDEIQKQQEQVTKTLDELRQELQKSQPRN